MFTQTERTEQITPFEEITPFGEELSEEMLELVAGGMMAREGQGRSKICVPNGGFGGNCWPD